MNKLEWLVPGRACEVLMQEEGLWGSHYTAKILEVTKQKAKVEFDVRKHPTHLRLHLIPAAAHPLTIHHSPLSHFFPRRPFMRRARR